MLKVHTIKSTNVTSKSDKEENSRSFRMQIYNPFEHEDMEDTIKIMISNLKGTSVQGTVKSRVCRASSNIHIQKRLMFKKQSKSTMCTNNITVFWQKERERERKHFIKEFDGILRLLSWHPFWQSQPKRVHRRRDCRALHLIFFPPSLHHKGTSLFFHLIEHLREHFMSFIFIRKATVGNLVRAPI